MSGQQEQWGRLEHSDQPDSLDAAVIMAQQAGGGPDHANGYGNGGPRAGLSGAERPLPVRQPSPRPSPHDTGRSVFDPIPPSDRARNLFDPGPAPARQGATAAGDGESVPADDSAAGAAANGASPGASGPDASSTTTPLPAPVVPAAGVPAAGVPAAVDPAAVDPAAVDPAAVDPVAAPEAGQEPADAEPERPAAEPGLPELEPESELEPEPEPGEAAWAADGLPESEPPAQQSGNGVAARARSRAADVPARRPDHPGRVADQPALKPAPGSWADLRQRLERLPYGHPSSPYHVDGERKSSPPRLRHLELAPPARERIGDPMARPGRNGSADTQANAGAAEPTGQAGAHEPPGEDAAAPLPQPAPAPPAQELRTGAAPAIDGEDAVAAAPDAENAVATPAAAGDAIATPAAEQDAVATPAAEPAARDAEPASSEPAAGGAPAGSPGPGVTPAAASPGSQPRFVPAAAATGQPPAGPAPEVSPTLAEAAAAAPASRPPVRPGPWPVPASADPPAEPTRSAPNFTPSAAEPIQDAERGTRPIPRRPTFTPHRDEPTAMPEQPAVQPSQAPGPAQADQQAEAGSTPSVPGVTGPPRGTTETTQRRPAARSIRTPQKVTPTARGPGFNPAGNPPRLATDGSWAWGPAKLTADQVGVADDAYDRFRAAEGRDLFGSYVGSGLTTKLRQAEERMEHGSLDPNTEEHALLEIDVFRARFAEMLRRYPDRSPELLAMRVPGALSYAFIFQAEHYADGIVGVQDALEAQGFELQARKNSWSSSKNRCVYTMWHDPLGELPFEVQFHTSASLEAQHLARSSANRINDPRIAPEEAASLRSDLASAWAVLPMPPGNDEIGDYRRYGSAAPRR
jgi:hypothetical protein